MSSSYAADNKETFVKRYCKASKSKVDVKCPMIISEYNQLMGGVDLAGMRHCKMLNEKKVMSLKDFKLSISFTLLQKGKTVSRMATNSVKIKQPVVPRPEKDIRTDGLHHIPGIVKKGRCRNCTTGQTVISCLKCNTRLCLMEKQPLIIPTWEGGNMILGSSCPYRKDHLGHWGVQDDHD
ncbi:hypothetical protein HW555_008158 [Spodoptera exigua]|uniref:Uncharacterized protein n=1 Tax=Spodoptera exigua TaxID=7107 RepID=A0A835L860_SPOEX|nr:hypothetical protein HW555_008158 [Spodoptera exigua]